MKAKLQLAFIVIAIALFFVMLGALLDAAFGQCSNCVSSIMLTGWTVITNSGTVDSGGGGGSGTLSLTAPGYYVDYSVGDDTLAGTNIASAWRHAPGDHAATGKAASAVLGPGSNVWFKGGVTYTLSPYSATSYSANQGGIKLNWNGTAANPIRYAATNAWGTGRAAFVDGYTSNWICAFYSAGDVTGVRFDNLELGPIGGSASLPSDPGGLEPNGLPHKPGAGILTGGRLISVTVANCYFHQLGYWFNAKPMGEDSIWGEGIQCADSIGLTVTNCEFTEMLIGLELPISGTTSNLTIANCNFHDAVVWCIDLARSQTGCNLDYVSIVGCAFSNYCQAWNNWTGYGGWPHADGIFDRGDYLTTFHDGTHIYFYNNVFFDSQTGASTAAIFMEGGVSAWIYNNLFSTVNSVPIEPHNDGQSATTSTNFFVGIYNNTFYEVNNDDVNPWGDTGVPLGVWRIATANAPQLDVQNNIFYDTGSGDHLLQLDVTNTAAAYPGFHFDYNCYRTTASKYVFQLTAYNTWTNTDINGLHGYGWETHGITNPATLFVDATSTAYSITNNYGLKTGSACIGAGTNLTALGLPGLANDITGKSRGSSWDIGAYQH